MVIMATLTENPGRRLLIFTMRDEFRLDCIPYWSAFDGLQTQRRVDFETRLAGSVCER